MCPFWEKFIFLTNTHKKPYKCGQCGKSFSLVSNLETVVPLHTGDKTPHNSPRATKAVKPLLSHRKNKSLLNIWVYSCRSNLSWRAHITLKSLSRPNAVTCCFSHSCPYKVNYHWRFYSFRNSWCERTVRPEWESNDIALYLTSVSLNSDSEMLAARWWFCSLVLRLFLSL